MTTYRQLRILIADDDRTMRFTIQHGLQTLGCLEPNIEQVADGEETISIIDEAHAAGKSFHLVLLDWHMPGKKGSDVLSECTQKPYFNNTAFVMLTGELGEENVKQAIELGAVSYIAKPVSADLLKKHMARVLRWLNK